MTSAEFDQIVQEMKDHEAATSFPAVDEPEEHPDAHAEYGAARH